MALHPSPLRKGIFVSYSLSPSPSTRPSALAEDDLLHSAKALVPVLTEYAKETEQQRRVAEPAFIALRRAGLLRMATPRVFGGYEATTRTSIEVCAALAHGCASSSWVVGIVYGGARYAAQLPAEVRQEIWGGDPDAVVCGSVTPSGTVRQAEGALVLSGRWPWASGVRHASWVFLGIKPPGREKDPDRTLGLLRAEEVAIDDTWYVAGMRGTGSETIVAEEVTVPDDRLVSFAEVADGVGVRRHPQEPRATLPLSINLPLVGTGIGIAEAAFAHVVGKLTSGQRRASLLHSDVTAAASHQLLVADVAMLIDTAWLHVLRTADELDDLAQEGRRPDLRTRARMRVDSTRAMDCARKAVSLLTDIAGSGSFADGSFLQRAWRDIETSSHHASFSTNVAREVYGRVLLGQELPPDPLI